MRSVMKSRARLVCVQCHGRKIKCDLEESTDNTCGYCRRHHFPCIRREGVRKRTRASQRRPPAPNAPDSPVSSVQGEDSLALSENAADTVAATSENSAYIAEHSVLQSADNAKSVDTPALPSCRPKMVSGMSSEVKLSILRATDAHKLPKPALQQALFDAFFNNLDFCFPIVNRTEVESPGSSVLLQQAVCLAGSLTRHPNLPDSFLRAKAIYEKIKILICVNFEPNMLVVLKVLALLSLWSPIPSHMANLDGPWHSTGQAIRLGIQMGMHKNSTYTGKSDRSCQRRLWWLLYASDCVLALIYGRVPALKEGDFDVSPLTEEDFDVVNPQARNFIADVHLGRIMGSLAHGISQNIPSEQQDTPIMELLTDWITKLHPDLHLYDRTGRRTTYRHPVTELHIEYLGTVILSQAMSYRSAKQWPCSVASLLAASCIASLYEEVLYRDQVAILTPMHPFWCLTAAIPLLYYKPETAALEAQRKEHLAALGSVIEQLRQRFGLANSVAHKMTLLEEQRNDIISQAVSPGRDGFQTQNISAMQHMETNQLNALFPQLNAWTASAESSLNNPILDTIAQSQAQYDTQNFGMTMQGISGADLWAFDALGASGFMDDFYGNNYSDVMNLQDQMVLPDDL